jgi:Lanthionine-containing peptide SapB precursor RamS
MALLDLQAMDSARDGSDTRCGGSDLSVLLCDSVASITLCL